MGSPQQPRPFSEQLREGSESPETGLIISFIKKKVELVSVSCIQTGSTAEGLKSDTD